MIFLVIEAPGTVSKSAKNKRPEKIGIKAILSTIQIRELLKTARRV